MTQKGNWGAVWAAAPAPNPMERGLCEWCNVRPVRGEGDYACACGHVGWKTQGKFIEERNRPEVTAPSDSLETFLVLEECTSQMSGGGGTAGGAAIGRHRLHSKAAGHGRGVVDEDTDGGDDGDESGSSPSDDDADSEDDPDSPENQEAARAARCAMRRLVTSESFQECIRDFHREQHRWARRQDAQDWTV